MNFMPREYPLERVRDIGIIAHIDAGKTTVSERILFYTGVSHKIGEVHEGEAIMDWMEQERERGITITAAATTCYWTPVGLENKPENKIKINLIDTPGHIDFTVEVKRSLRVLDGAVVIFDGVAGVEPQSETNWRYADEYNVPRMCFINKLDRTGASFEKSLASIHERLTLNAVPVTLPIGIEDKFEGVIDLIEEKAVRFLGENGEKVEYYDVPENLKEQTAAARRHLLEKAVETDDALMEKYLERQEISKDEIRSAIRKAVIDNKFVPVFCGSALKNKGVQLVLDGVIDYLPSPLDVPPTKGIEPKTGGEIERHPDENEPFAALAFKIATDPYVGSLTYFRVYSGKLTKGSYILNSTKDSKERIGRILLMHANEREEIDEIRAGEIAAAVGLKDTTTGDTLCDEENPIILEKIVFPEPVISQKIEPKTKADQEKMGLALKRLSDEDPTFRIKTDQETGETIISGMGELHLEIIVDRMLREFKVSANVGRPQVAYKETVKKIAEAEGKYIRQSGGRGQYGHVWIRVEPNDRGGGFEFINEIKGGIVPQEFIPAIEKGVREAMEKGIKAGFPMVDMKAAVYDGSYHEVDSSEAAFKIAASIALQEASKRANLVLLEPIMKVEVIVPEQFFGDITGDLNSKRGKIEQMSERAMTKVVDAKVPLSEMFGYATKLRSMSQGRASYTMEFDHYEEVPNNVAELIIAGKK